jgi:hypothetical protein
MSLLDYARHQIVAFDNEIKQVKESEFPYIDSEDLLKTIESSFESHLSLGIHFDPVWAEL